MITPNSLDDYQILIAELSKKRGFDVESISEKYMLLLEEVGEFAKAARKANGMLTSEHSKNHNLEEEAADVFWLLIDLCNKQGINLAKAFSDKEKINDTRSWSSITK